MWELASLTPTNFQNLLFVFIAIHVIISYQLTLRHPEKIEYACDESKPLKIRKKSRKNNPSNPGFPQDQIIAEIKELKTKISDLHAFTLVQPRGESKEKVKVIDEAKEGEK